MSKIGKQPVQLESGTTIKIDGRVISVTGPKGALEFKMPRGVTIVVNDSVAIVKKEREDYQLNKFYGLTRTLLANAVEGVNRGFEKKLELQGVGYRARIDGQNLVLNLGFANPVIVSPLEGISFKAVDGIITVAGIDKAIVGDMAAKIRAVRPPDPYKGKGLRYFGEIIKKKAGKSAKAVGGK